MVTAQTWYLPWYFFKFYLFMLWVEVQTTVGQVSGWAG
jgi:hypothetical protein